MGKRWALVLALLFFGACASRPELRENQDAFSGILLKSTKGNSLSAGRSSPVESQEAFLELELVKAVDKEKISYFLQATVTSELGIGLLKENSLQVKCDDKITVLSASTEPGLWSTAFNQMERARYSVPDSSLFLAMAQSKRVQIRVLGKMRNADAEYEDKNFEITKKFVNQNILVYMPSSASPVNLK